MQGVDFDTDYFDAFLAARDDDVDIAVVNHVSTQLPYAITAASCAAVCYLITGLAQAVLGSRASLFTSLVLLAVAIVIELVVLSIIRARTIKKTKA